MTTGERVYGGLTGAERDARRRDALLDSALELFGTNGYLDTTITELCQHAHVSTRSFYQQYAGLEDVLADLYDRVVQDTMQRVLDALAEAGEDPVDRARAGLAAFVHALLDDPRRGRVHAVEIVGVSPRLEQHRRTVLRTYQDLVAEEAQRLVADELIPTRDWHPTALLLVGGANELVVDWVLGDSRPPIDELVDELVRGLFALAGRLDLLEQRG